MQRTEEPLDESQRLQDHLVYTKIQSTSYGHSLVLSAEDTRDLFPGTDISHPVSTFKLGVYGSVT